MIIGHKYPLLLIDRVESLEVMKRVVAFKNISMNEKIFKGHFPDKPIYPAIYLIEGLCQCAQLVLGAKIAVTAKLDGFKFSRPVLPGDKVIYEVILKEQVGKFIICTAKATVNDQKVATGTITGCEF